MEILHYHSYPNGAYQDRQFLKARFLLLWDTLPSTYHIDNDQDISDSPFEM